MPIVYNDPLRGRPREASRIPAPTSAVLTEQFAQTFEENPIAASKRWYDLNQQKRSGTRIDAASARQQIKDAGMEVDLTVDDAGITQEALDTLIWRKKVEKRRQDTFARAQGGFSEGAARLGVAAATTLADPISAGLNFVPVVGQARYARWLNQARGVGGRIAVRAGVGAAEGAAGAAIVEPLIYASRTAEQADYDAADSLLNVAFGGLIGTGMHTTVGSLGEVFARRPRADGAVASAGELARSMKPEDFQATVRAAVGQAVEGRSVDVDGVVRAANFIPDEERLLSRQIREALSQRENSLRNLIEGPEGRAVNLRGDDVSERLARAIAGRDEDALTVAGDLNEQIAEESRRLAQADNANTYAIRRSRDQGQPDAIFQRWRSRAEENVAGTRARAQERVEQANQLIESLQSDMERLRRVRSAESDLSASRQAISAARTLDELVDALPSDMQAGFRRRVAQGRADGYVRGPGARLAQPDAAEVTPAAPSVADEATELDAYAEEVVAREPPEPTPEDVLAAVKEEESLATQELKQLYDRLGRELKSAEYDEIIEAANNAERWARTAELATVCLVRGG